MAQQVSDRLSATYRFPNHPQLYLKIRSRSLRQQVRGVLRTLFPSSVVRDTDVTAEVSRGLEGQSANFRRDHWGYVDGFWESDFHRKMIEHWPPDRFFNPIKYVTKSYDSGFLWTQGAKTDPEHLHHFPAYKAAYDYLRSTEFAKRVIALAGDGLNRKCYRIMLTRSYWGSSIIPHIDSNNTPGTINFVIFINGGGGFGGGGLGLWEDNEFQKPIFVTENLVNTCLFYDMSEDFYHGFKPMRYGAFRWSINAAFEQP